MVTLDYALNYADRVRSLTLIEPPAFWVLEGKLDLDAKKTVQMLRTLRGDISEDMLEEFMQGVGWHS